jgi:hypothetical protein
MDKKNTALRGRNIGNKYAVALNWHTPCSVGLMVFVCSALAEQTKKTSSPSGA